MNTGLKTWDKITNKRIDTLHPSIRKNVTLAINEVYSKLGIKLRVTDAFRSLKEQIDLYSVGRDEGGKIINKDECVTWTVYGSLHIYGLAFDICEIKGKSASWNLDWISISNIIKGYGFEWGYDLWKKDKPHFQRSYGLSTAQLKQKEIEKTGHFIILNNA